MALRMSFTRDDPQISFRELILDIAPNARIIHLGILLSLALIFLCLHVLHPVLVFLCGFLLAGFIFENGFRRQICTLRGSAV